MAGLLGSGHCFGMCGGIAGSLGMMAGRGGRRAAVLDAALFNLARILAYAGLGALAGLVVGGAGEALSVPGWGRWLRVATAVLIGLVGLRFLFDWRGLERIERLGAGLWRRVSPLAMRAARWPGPTGRLLLGACWGLLPCGLVYTMLLTGAASGTAAGGALVMFAFGLGTLPSMLGLSLAAPTLDGLLRETAVRRFIGLGLVLLAGWALIMALGLAPGQGGHEHMHH
jgi:sulfite exporter TauE/SafE